MKRTMLTTMTALAALLLALPASAEIKIGITVSASGPGAALGQPQLKSIAALPKEINGEKVTYIGLDDGSEPTKAVQNVRKLISEDKVEPPPRWCCRWTTSVAGSSRSCRTTT